MLISDSAEVASRACLYARRRKTDVHATEWKATQSKCRGCSYLTTPPDSSAKRFCSASSSPKDEKHVVTTDARYRMSFTRIPCRVGVLWYAKMSWLSIIKMLLRRIGQSILKKLCTTKGQQDWRSKIVLMIMVLHSALIPKSFRKEMNRLQACLISYVWHLRICSTCTHDKTLKMKIISALPGICCRRNCQGVPESRAWLDPRSHCGAAAWQGSHLPQNEPTCLQIWQVFVMKPI